VSSLSSRASGYVTTVRTRASAEYDKLAKRGQKALNGQSAGQAKRAVSSRQSAGQAKGAVSSKQGSSRSTKS
jgi:hypothetical protein